MEELSASDAIPVQEISVQRYLGPNYITSLMDLEPNLVNMYHDLLIIAEKLTTRVREHVDREIAAAAIRKREGDGGAGDDVSDDDDEDETDADTETETEDEAAAEKPKKKGGKSACKPTTELEQLLGVLRLSRKQKQHLLIKRAILLKFEEKMFGNNNITMTIDLRQLGEESKDGKLERILNCRDLSRYMPREMTDNGNSMEYAEKAMLREIVTAAKQPPDILAPLRKKTPKKIARNLILQQYNIRWNTNSGEATPFDFYTLPKHFVKGVVRKAWVQTQMYEHKSAIANLHELTRTAGDEMGVEHFCPGIAYLKRDPYAQPGEDNPSELPVRLRDQPKYSWQGWSFNNPTPDSSTSQDLGFDFPEELSWISPKVKTLIKKLSEPIQEDFNPETTCNVMYMLVVQETLSPRLLEDGGMKSQVYIGGADEGIKERFMGEDSHSRHLVDIRRHFTDIEYFAPHPTALLVEMRLLLAMARNEKHALFILKVCDSPRALGKEVHDLIIQTMWLASNEVWGPAVNMNFGLNLKEELKKRRKFLPDSFPGSNKHK